MISTTRFIRTFVTTAALALTVAPVASASTTRIASDDVKTASCPPITRTGTYRIEIKREGKEPTFALLVLERASGCLSALLVTDNGPSPLEITAVNEETLTANFRAGRKDAVMSLRFNETGVKGEVSYQKKTFGVSGERTS